MNRQYMNEHGLKIIEKLLDLLPKNSSIHTALLNNFDDYKNHCVFAYDLTSVLFYVFEEQQNIIEILYENDLVDNNFFDMFVCYLIFHFCKEGIVGYEQINYLLKFTKKSVYKNKINTKISDTISKYYKSKNSKYRLFGYLSQPNIINVFRNQHKIKYKNILKKYPNLNEYSFGANILNF